MKKDLICIKHQEIVNICESLLKLDYDKPFKKELQTKLKQIIKITESARKDGQDMEDRLSEYYDAITEIGFKRVKK